MGEDLWPVVTGGAVAVFAGIVIPFVTSEVSKWSEQRREVQRSRRAAFDRFLTSDEQPRADFYRDYTASRRGDGDRRTSGALRDYETAEYGTAKRLLLSHFTVGDAPIREVFLAGLGDEVEKISSLPPAHLTVVATWAAGRNVRARLAAKRLLRQSAAK